SNSTGFIENCATSFWTGDSGTYWQNVTARPSACLTSTYSLYSDAPDGPLIERGAAGQKLRGADPTKRNIRTCAKTDCSTGLMACNTTSITTTGTLTSPQPATLINWPRGVNTGDGFTDSSATTYTQYGLAGTIMRPTAHGEVVHSRPLAVNYGVSGVDD